MYQSIKKEIFSALKKNLVPGLVLQLFAGAIVCIYFFVPQSQPAFAVFSDLKKTYGLIYAFISTAFFGGLIPFLYLHFSNSFRSQENYGRLFFFYIFFWGLKGMEVDLFYQFQAYIFGTGNDIKTILCKTFFDQLLYSTFWAAPGITIIYLWVENNFEWSKTRAAMTPTFFRVKIPTVILSNWMVWFPAVSIVYTMPSDLQIPLFNLVLCFWVLLLAVLNKK